jgi:N-acyl homoserine lactone hydrolase
MKIHALQTGTVAVKRRQRSGTGPGPVRAAWTMLDRRWTEPLPILAWLVEHPDGLIVVDTGETARATEPGWFPRWHPYFRLGVREWVTAEEEVGPRLRALGFSPEDVRRVVMTHLHTDHAGGLEHFPDSEIVVHRPEFEAARGLMGQVRGFLPHRWPAWFSPRLVDLEAEPFGPFPRSLRLADGVTIVGTPGHTPGHVSVVVEEGDRLVFLAGDASYTDALAVDGVTAAPATARETLDRIRALARERPTVYLPSHDPGSVARLEAGETL